MSQEEPYSVQVNIGQEGLMTTLHASEHQLVADEPKSVGGSGLGPTPYDYLLASLGACTAMTLRLYADRKKWPLEGVEVHLRHSKDYHNDCLHCEELTTKVDQIDRQIHFKGSLDAAKIKRLLVIADKCPVHKTLTSQTIIKTTIVEA